MLTRQAHRFISLQAALLVGAAALLALVGVTVALSLSYEYRAEVESILGSDERTTQKLASHTAAVFDQVNQTTLLVKYLRESGQLPSLRSLNQGGVLAGGVTRAVYVTDANGVVINATMATPLFSIAGENHFKSHKEHDGLGIVIAAPAADPLGGVSIAVSRRLNRPNGEFAGVVVANVDPATLSREYASSEKIDTVLGVIGTDGIFRSRLINSQQSFGEKIDSTLMDDRADKVRTAFEPTVSPVDGVARFVSLTRVDRYPLVAMVAVNAQSALQEYRHAKARILAWAATIALLIIGAAAGLFVQARDLDRTRRRALRAEFAFRATLVGSMDAITIMQAERDSAGRLVDLIVTEANACAAALIGKDPGKVVGRRLGELLPSLRQDGSMRRFDKTIKSGRSREGELQATQPELASRWLHHQLVPMGDGIALITRDVTARKEIEKALAEQARVDALTQVANLRQFEHCLREARERALRRRDWLALLYIDLDGFKMVNDTFGHAAGDVVLVEVARRLRAAVRTIDTVSRLGGDEFTIIMEGAAGENEVRDFCERILEAMAVPHLIDGHRLTATVSIGVAMLSDAERAESLRRRADDALYLAKRAGKSRYWLVAGGKRMQQPELVVDHLL